MTPALENISPSRPPSRPLTFHIRQANLQDFEAMAPLWHQLDIYHSERDPSRFPRPVQVNPRRLDYVCEQLHRADRTLLLAETYPRIPSDKPELLGLCLVTLRTQPPGPVYPARVIFEIENLIVDHMSRRKGIARDLVREAESWARAHGAEEMVLNVYDFNVEAKQFYEQLGFVPSRIHMVHSLY